MEQASHGPARAGPLGDRLSWLRTRLSAERTLLSWTRTATALIAFGFTVFQFLERLGDIPGVGPARTPWTSRVIGLSLVGTGTLVLLLAMLEYRSLLAWLWSDELRAIAGVHEVPQRTPALLAATLVVLIGVVTVVILALRIPAGTRP